MKTSLRRELTSILGEAPSVREDANTPERAFSEAVVLLAARTAAYRKDLMTIMDKLDPLEGKLPEHADALDHMVGAIEMSDEMLEDLVDATVTSAKPLFKKLGLAPPKH